MRAKVCSAAVALSLVASTGLAAQGLRAFGFHDGTFVSVYADGNLKTALGQTDGTTVAAGSLGFQLTQRRTSVNLLINAAGTTQALRSNQAATVLAPGNGGSLSAGYGEVRVLAKGSTFGFRSYITVSSSDWVDTTANRTVSALTGGIGVGPFLKVFGGRIGEKPAQGAEDKRTTVGGMIDLGLAWRTLGGDIAQPANKQALTNILTSDTKDRVGLEVGLTLQVNDLRAGLTYYLFGGNIPGLSHGQVIAGFSVSTPLLSGRLDGSAEPQGQ